MYQVYLPKYIIMVKGDLYLKKVRYIAFYNNTFRPVAYKIIRRSHFSY